MSRDDLYDVIVVGGGPAGLTAGLYLARARYRVLILEKDDFGGQITITNEVVNYPGVGRTTGRALTQTMRQQAQDFGAEFLSAEAIGLDVHGDVKTVHTSRGDLKAFGILLATGASPRKLGFEGESEYAGRGVAYCATCDGEFFAEMEPEELVATLDFRYLTDALTPQEAIEILRAAQEGKAERIVHLKEVGYPGYSTAAGWLGYSDEKMVRLAKQETEVMGFKQIKLKVGQNLEDDLRRLKLAREAVGPDIAIAVDANQVWDVPQAIEWIGKFKDYDLAWVEEPTCLDDVLGHAAIQKAIERMGPSPAVAAWTALNAPMPRTMSAIQTLRLISSAVCMWKSTRTIRHWKIGCCPKTMILCCWQHLCGPPLDRPCAWRS